MPKKFCIVPWRELYSTSIGTYRMCCDEEENDISRTHQTPIDQKIEAHWNSEYMRNSRHIFLSEQLHPNCGRCWADEENNKISLRMRRNKRYLGINNDNELSSEIEKIKTITNEDGSVEVSQIRGAHLSVGNICQLRCTHCGPAYSNNVAKEYIKLGWSSKENTRRSVFIDKYMGVPQQKLYDADFWPQIKSIAQNFESVSFTGGEPAISPGLKEFTEWLDQENLLQDIDIRISTNAVTIDDSWIDLLSKAKKAQIRISVDGYGDLENYTRYPTNWDRKLNNIKKIKSKIENVVLFTTIYSLNVCGYKTFLNETKDLEIQRDIGLLSWPTEFDIRHMPDEIKQKLSKDFIKIIALKNDFLLENGLKSVIKRLSMDRDPDQWNKAISIIHQYDTIRPKPLADLCPDLKPYI